MSLTRSSKRAIRARERARTETQTVTLTVEMLRVVHALQMAHNSGQSQAVVNLSEWRVEDIDNRAIIGLHGSV